MQVGATFLVNTKVCSPVAGMVSVRVAPQTAQVNVRTPGVVSVGSVVTLPLSHVCAPVAGISLVETTSPQLEQMVSTRPASPQVAGTVFSVVS